MSFKFRKLTCLQRKVQRKCIQMPGGGLPRLVGGGGGGGGGGRGLISACNRRVKSGQVVRVKISPLQIGIT